MANQSTDQVYVSLIIPIYNEEARIEKGLGPVLGYLASVPYSSEVVIVDDGSTDRSVELIRERYGSRRAIRVYQQPRNLGKGEAVKRGMLLGRGEYLFFSDVDLSVPIETLALFLGQLEGQCDIAIGTRQRSGASVEVRQPFYREFLGRIYTRLSNWILGLQISDFTCGFKGFRKAAARDLFSRQQLSNWSFDAEILYLARLKGYGVREIPVRWRNDERTKVRLARDILTSFLGLLKIRLYDYEGRYQ